MTENNTEGDFIGNCYKTIREICTNPAQRHKRLDVYVMYNPNNDHIYHSVIRTKNDHVITTVTADQQCQNMELHNTWHGDIRRAWKKIHPNQDQYVVMEPDAYYFFNADSMHHAERITRDHYRPKSGGRAMIWKYQGEINNIWSDDLQSYDPVLLNRLSSDIRGITL